MRDRETRRIREEMRDEEEQKARQKKQTQEDKGMEEGRDVLVSPELRGSLGGTKSWNQGW